MQLNIYNTAILSFVLSGLLNWIILYGTKSNKFEKSSEKNDEIIKDITQQIINLGGKPTLDQKDQKSLIKNLTKQFCFNRTFCHSFVISRGY